MQVSQLAELDSHAVIGGSKPQEFFMSDSAEFFTILSNTLYRDKEMAVVREVICNAHDAHVKGNCLDKAIEVIITDKELTIKDHGPGIPDELMHPTFCGYGATTKVDDVTQIGGFGLGCKAPFAVSDHFTVVSHHGGFKSVYAMSRGGIDTKGKPAMIRMVKVPSTETGVTVSIPVKSQIDQRNFGMLARQVVRNGGMNATINGGSVDALDFTGIEKSGYGLLFDGNLTESSIYVRLGSVLYPVSTTDLKLTALVSDFANNVGMKIIIFARPGEVGVTPSREALSYSEQTIASLTEKLTTLKKRLLHMMPVIMQEVAKENVAKNKNLSFNTNLNYPKTYSKFTCDFHQISLNFFKVAVSNSGILTGFRLATGSYKKAIFKAAMHKHRDQRRLFRRLQNNIVANKLEKQHKDGWHQWYCGDGKLLIRIANKLGIMKYVSRLDREGFKIVPIIKDVSAFSCKPIIVLVRSREQATNYVSATTKASMAFIVVRDMKPERIAEIRQTFQKHKFELIELDISKPAPKPKVVKVEPEKHTFATLNQIYNESYKPVLATNPKTVDHAPVFIKCGTINDEREFRGYSLCKLLAQKESILKVYPSVALAIGAAQTKALIKAGSIELIAQFSVDILDVPVNDDTSFIYRASRGELFPGGVQHYDPKGVVNVLCGFDLRFAKQLFGRGTTVTAEEEKFYNLFNLFRASNMAWNPDYEKACKHYNEIDKASRKYKPKAPDVEYLKLLGSLLDQYSRKDIVWSEDLADMINYLKTRAEAQVKSTPTLVKLKEAA